MKEALKWHDFWARVGSVGIRTKIMGIVGAAILLLGLAVVWYASRDVSITLRNELQRRAIAVGTNLMQQSRDLVLTDNQFALYNLVMNTVETDEDVIYAFVVDDSGDVLVHSFADGFPPDLLKANHVPSGVPYRVQRLQTEQGIIMDVDVPILDGRIGVIHLGVSENSINAAVVAYVEKILAWTAFTLVLGLFFAYAVASFLTKPLSTLAQAAKAVGSGDFAWQAPPWAKDEIGTLGVAFDDMGKQLRHKEEMRTHLLAKVIHAQEEERKRVARELHDESGQALTSLMVNLKAAEESAESSQLKEKLAGLRAQAAQTLQGLHDLATELRPSLLDDVGLLSAVQKYAREYSSKTGISVDYEMSELENLSLPPEVETTVYRIVQEALTNVAKHAEASSVSIVAGLRDSALTMVVEDDGKGFDVERVMTQNDDERLGLFGMQERASLVGGKITIESTTGEGTTLFLEVPVKLAEGAV